ncbi:MAG: hypothetical protein ACRDVZ_07710 [Jiangellaceae bacterium]
MMALAACTSSESTAESAVADPEPVESFALNMVECMTDRGWSVHADSAGNSWSMDAGIPESQMEQFESDSRSCEEEFGYDVLAPPPSREEAEELYDQLLTVAECVRDLGYPVEYPQSKQSYVEELMASKIPSWHPYNLFYASIEFESELNKVQDACPVEWLPSR